MPDWTQATWSFGGDPEGMPSTSPTPKGPAFEVVGELGRGAMGVVYLARDPLGRELAVKLIAESKGLKARARFAREGRACAALTFSPSPTTHSTRPPFVTQLLPSSLVPA